MPPSGAAGDAPENWGKHNGKDLREVAEGCKEGRRQAGHDKAGPPLRLQPSDSEGRRRHPRTGLHRRHAGLETRYRVKVAFFRCASLSPIPPGESMQKEVRYLDIHEHDELDEAQLAAWVKQASLLPGKQM